MALRLGDTVPNFTQSSSEGEINFYDWAGDSWVVLFSHPADYTPVCTTELGEVAKLKPEFDKRNAKVIALSVTMRILIRVGFRTLTKPRIRPSTTRFWQMRIKRCLICTT